MAPGDSADKNFRIKLQMPDICLFYIAWMDG